MKYHILDTETASLHGGVVELAFLEVDENLNITREFQSYVNPERPIEEGAFAVHGISDDMVVNAPTLAEVAAKELPEPIKVICHNAPFDVRMLGTNVELINSLCTLSLSRQYIKGTSNHKLETLQRELNLPKQKSHSALGDVHTVRDLLLHLLPKTGRDLETLFNAAKGAKMLPTMPFGKFRGLPMMQVPKPYRVWLQQQEGLDKDLAYTLKRLEVL